MHRNVGYRNISLMSSIERGFNPPSKPPEKPLTVDEVYELIYQNEANENTMERYRRREELSYLLDEAEDREEQNDAAHFP